MPCRVNIRRKKTARFLLERNAHPWTSFCTLTIDDDHLEYALGVDAAPVWTVRPRTLQSALKRMRHHCSERFRFVGVGEYGTRTGRPHYHLLVFGPHPAVVETALEAAWPCGHIQVKACDQLAQVAYVAGYTVKKLTKREDERLDGNHPEFFRQSLRPAIGHPSLDWLEHLHYTYGGAKELAETGDVMRTFRMAGKKWPLDRWARDQLRERLGVPKRTRPTQDGMIANTAAERRQARSAHARMVRRHSRGAVF